MQKREILQKRIIEKFQKTILSYKDKLLFAEIPTGTGKTKILLDTAKILLQKNRPVIISTSNNFLAMEYLKEAQKFDIDKKNISIVVGKDNYISPKSVLSDEFAYEFGLSKKEIRYWLEENKNYPLVQFFMEYFDLPKEAEDIVKTKLHEEEESRGVKMVVTSMANNPKIYITNHHYLLALLKYADIDDFYKMDILSDEVHALNDTARMLYKTSFSPFRMLYMIKAAIYQNSIPKSHIKKLKSLLEILNWLLSESKAYVLRGEGDKKQIDLLQKFVESKVVADVIDTLRKSRDRSKYKDILDEFKEARTVLSKRDMAFVSFSPVKLYPKYEVFSENPVAILRKILSKHKGNFIGTSGTLRVDVNPSISANEWSFQRIGFYKYKNVETEGQFLFNKRITNMEFAVYPRIFSKKQARYRIAEDERLKPPSRKERDEKYFKLYRKWVENLARFASENIYGNTLILMSSYENVELMRDYLVDMNMDKEYEIFANTYGTNMRTIVKSYKKAIDEGKKAILIGGLNFYTGIDLHGDYLQTLFVGKLPIEPRSNYFTKQKIGEYSVQADMRKNALLMFRQGIGRAIRSEKDKAFIVVADPRINERRYMAFRQFLDECAMKVS